MKTLFVLRHAKSSWNDANLSDFERPLNRRGRETAPFMGDLIQNKNLVPEVIICSPAERAKETAMLVKKSAGFDVEIEFNERIYESSTHNLLYIIGKINDDFDSAMIVGHNPGFEGIVETLCGNYERMPTATLAVIDLNCESWNDVKPNCGNLREILRPKEQMK